MDRAIRPRPRTLASSTTVLNTSEGDLYLTVALDGDGEPLEMFGRMGKAGSFDQGVTELACRLISLHLRRGTPLEDLIDQCRGVGGMEPRLNRLGDDTPVFVLGLGDGIAHILKGFAREGNHPEERARSTKLVRPSVAEHEAEFVRVA